MDRIYGAVRTGITMTTTTLAAVLVVLIFVNSDVIKQIMLILFIGLLVDMVMTWIQNVGILRLYLEMKKK
jgi:preprotein translocase subunit SecF